MARRINPAIVLPDLFSARLKLFINYIFISNVLPRADKPNGFLVIYPDFPVNGGVLPVKYGMGSIDLNLLKLINWSEVFITLMPHGSDCSTRYLMHRYYLLYEEDQVYVRHGDRKQLSYDHTSRRL